MPAHLAPSFWSHKTVMFELKPINPETYRQQTRRSTLYIALTFIVLALLVSGLAVMVLGVAGGDNFRLNLAGVIVALIATVLLVRYLFWTQPWMAAAVYGWQLKRSLMKVTNVMHHVTAGVMAGNVAALKLLRFYHLGVTQMYQLDANSSALSQMVREIDLHKARLEALGIDPGQTRLDPQWIVEVKKYAPLK